MIVEEELRQQMQRALSGELRLSDLYVWVMGRSWNMHKDSTPQACDLTANVECAFAERSAGDITDAELTEQLRALLSAEVKP
jgi:hypothetical protein